ncbi:insulinase family protein [Ramlibacter sp. G-1-2-2]|uniref:Insulinase family protein n=1 Tax=Ramlibacter agri TaxID=2728837 RepID=A0A848HCA5_9BURK|nr:pitrilysin family protein [Ramlibacter agri]NML47119.1 insulinase family protein [Ramlibacter agri]
MSSPLPAPVLHTLANGVRLLAVPFPQGQSASVGVFLRAGSRDETAASNGIGHVLEHMAFKGTQTRSVQAINLDAERLGADVNAFTSKDSTGYFMTGLGRHAPQLLEMTADIVLNSTFPEQELTRELEVIRQEAIEYEEDPEDKSGELLDKAIWGGHPLGMPVIGTLENLDVFTRQHVVDHVQAHYLGGNAVVAAAGHFDVDAFFALGERLFTGMPDAASAARGPARYVGGALGQRFTGVSQVFLNMAWPVTPPAGQQAQDQRWRVAGSLAALLFGGGMSAPFTDTVRERLGLAYTAHSYVENGDGWFNFIVQAVTTPDKLDDLVDATGRLLREQAAQLDPVHVERARNQLAVSRVRAAERSYAAMERAVDDLFFLGEATALPQTLQLIEEITADEVRAVFERMLAHPVALAITGKAATAKRAKELAGRVAAR